MRREKRCARSAEWIKNDVILFARISDLCYEPVLLNPYFAFALFCSFASNAKELLPDTEANLQNHGHYRNVDGEAIHSPAKTKDGTIPAGASAKYRDSSYSFSTHHTGTCSGHGGVAEWLH